MKKGLCFITALLCTAVLAGCSAEQVVDELVEDAAGTTLVSTPAPTAAADTREADPTIAQPVFETIISGSTNMSVGSTIELNGSAKSPDNGEITYQWYRNNVDSNGGGTPVIGATDAVYTVRADEVGSTFYYVVAANNHGNKCNMITSSTYEVVTYKNGTWTEDEFGKKYVNEDGTYPTELWLMIDGAVYHFDSAGYITTGWLASGNTYYYFDEEGRILSNGKTPDGFETDANGKLIGNGVPQLYPTTAEIAAQAKAAADAQGDAAANAAEKEKAEAAKQSKQQATETPAPEAAETPAPEVSETPAPEIQETQTPEPEVTAETEAEPAAELADEGVAEDIAAEEQAGD